nr:MAG TPA: hypothetical protein [Caudoviricetes sp.]
MWAVFFICGNTFGNKPQQNPTKPSKFRQK